MCIRDRNMCSCVKQRTSVRSRNWISGRNLNSDAMFNGARGVSHRSPAATPTNASTWAPRWRLTHLRAEAQAEGALTLTSETGEPPLTRQDVGPARPRRELPARVGYSSSAARLATVPRSQALRVT